MQVAAGRTCAAASATRSLNGGSGRFKGSKYGSATLNLWSDAANEIETRGPWFDPTRPLLPQWMSRWEKKTAEPAVHGRARTCCQALSVVGA